MASPQPGILAPLAPVARFLYFDLLPDTDPRKALRRLAKRKIDDSLVICIGAPLAMALGSGPPGLRSFPAMSGPGFAIPSTQCALLGWLRGEDRGRLVHAGRELERSLEDAFELGEVVDAFVHDGGRDITGYVDGTENPVGDAAEAAGLLRGAGAGLDGSSFLAIQQWDHDLDHFGSLPAGERDAIIGRRRKDDTEIKGAPATAHVKRSEQESFDPPAFLVRRSMPWADADGEGLMFLAFAHSFDPYERHLRRMIGAEDGIVDALFRFTRPRTGSYCWCPPLRDGTLDLRALALDRPPGRAPARRATPSRSR